MNMQALMKQAQKIQSDMLKEKNEIDQMIFSVEKSFVKITARGNKKIESININLDEITKDDLEMIQDSILVAMNQILDDIDKETEKRLGKYSKGMPGLF